MDNSLHIPAFNTLIDHLKSFSDRNTLKGLWVVIGINKGDVDPISFTDREVKEWENITIGTTETLLANALLELNQLIRMSNPIDLEELYGIVSEARKDVTRALDRITIEETINNYNKNPDKKTFWTWVPDSEDSDDYVEGWGGENIYTITDEDFILKLEYLDTYMESIIEVHILPDFYSLTERVIRLFRVSQKADHIFGAYSFDENIRDKVKFNDVISELINRNFLVKEEGELYWKGIDRSNLGSIAALAKYLQEAKIMGYLGSNANTFEVYRTKFNIMQKDQKEWNKIYRSTQKDGLEFFYTNGKIDGASNFWDQLSFIFDIE